MSKIDEKYINSLDTFTSALEQIVELLKEQQKSNKADTVNEFLKAPMDNLVEVVADLKKVTVKGFAKVNADNKEILKKIESIKQQKEAGSFDKVEDPKNKNKIVDGIKVVILIAAGVLAIGMAFKIIGKVDFLSVIALSGAILMMSVAFSKIADIKNLTYSNVFVISSILPIMALGLLASGLILKLFPTIGLMQGLSMIVVAATVGVAAYLIITAMSKIDMKKNSGVVKAIPYILPQIALGLLASGWILKLFPTIGLMQGLSMIIVAATVGIAAYLLITAMSKIDIKKNGDVIKAVPYILPQIALGLLVSGWILNTFPIIGLMQGLSMIMVAATLGIAAYLLITTLSKFDIKKNWPVLVALPVILPLIAIGIALSSIILQKFVKIKNPIDLLIGSAVIGLSVLFFTPTIMLLGKMDLKQIVKGVLAIPMIAGAILATSWIFQLLPPKMTYPDWKWSLSVGLSVAVFALIVTGVGYLATKFKKEFEAGLLGVVGIAAVIAVADYFISQGEYGVYPDWKWSLSAGLSIGIFGLISFGVGFLANLNKTAFALGLLSVVGISAVILASDWILSKGKYDKYPDVEWAKGVGLSLGVFGVGSLAIGLIISTGAGAVVMGLGLASILVLAASMLAVDAIFKLGDFTKYPSEEWAKGVGKSMLLFSSFGVEGKPGILGAIGGAVSGFIKGIGGVATSATMIPIAMAMVAVDNILSQGDFSKYPTTDWVTNVAASLNAFSNIDVKANSIRNLADSFRDLSDSLKNVNSFDNLSKISSGLVLLSVIDDAKLQVVLDKIKDNENTLKSIYGDNSSGILNLMERMIQPVQATITPESILSLKTNTDDSEIKKTNSKLDEISSKLSQLLDAMNQPSQAGSFNK